MDDITILSPPAPVQRTRRAGKAILAIGLVLLMGIAGTAAAATRQFGTSFLPNTYIADVDVAGMNMAEAKVAIMAAVIGSDTVPVSFGGQTIELPKSELGVSYTVDESLRRAYASGHSGNYIDRFADIARSLFTPNRTPVSTSVDTVKALAWVDATLAPLVKDPVDATIGVTGSTVVINKSEDGIAIDLEKVVDDILTAAASSESPKVTVAMTVVPPTVTSDSLTTYRAELEKLARIPVRLTINNQTVSPTFAQQITWFTVPTPTSGGDETAVITLNSAAVARTVNEIAKKTNQKMVKEQVNPEGQVLVPGKDGLTIDEQAAVREIVAAFGANVRSDTAPTTVALAVASTVVPKEQVVVTTPQLASIGDVSVVPALDTDARFAQLNLAQQRIYLFENHQLINVFPISSGKAGYETPKGVHQIYNKAPRPLSRRYGLYLPYWNAITADGAYGIHDLPEWPSGYKETAAHLGTPVSHGCIRLGTEAAKYFYTWAPIGMAVVVQ